MPSDFKEKPACADMSAATPAEVECPACHAMCEAWSDETEVKCDECGLTFTRQ